VAEVATGVTKGLTADTHSSEGPVWSPDGRYLAFVSSRAGDTELYLMRADGTGQTRVTQSKGPDWLPRWLLPRPEAGR
jgi:TolB protein